VESGPGIATVTAVPATRGKGSNCWMRRSQKPQWRQWPTVAVSVWRNRAITSLLTCGGIEPIS
jgi:hypothetical protein